MNRKHVIIGTAGHVDHGKTCLIRALTGMDTDRLEEEKRRGITIELGFAYLDFPDGQRVGIVDVPGHEKFVKHMLAGAGGMDVAMLVVAADEGVMPQTVEHLDILSILGIQKGIVVLTKTDLVEPEFLELMREDIKSLVRGTFLETAPVIPVSVCTNKGMNQLCSELKTMCDSLPEREETGAFRLPIDRVFSLKGFGTIITGTLLDGYLCKNQTAVLYPRKIPVRIRNVQVYGEDIETACPGQRAAVNLADLKKEEIMRGDVLASSESLYSTRMLDVRVKALAHASRTIQDGGRFHIYLGTKELLGKVILLGTEAVELKAGEESYAQLRLEEEVAVKKGDTFVLRFYSPQETVGGGVVLDACPLKHKRHDRQIVRSFRIKENGTAAENLELAAREHWGCFYTLEELAGRCGIRGSVCDIRKTAESLEKQKRLIRLTGHAFIHRDEMLYYEKKVSGFLEEYHKMFPLSEGMKKEEVRSRINLKENERYADAVLNVMKKHKVIKEKQGRISRYSFENIPDKEEEMILHKITEDYQKAGFAPPASDNYLREWDVSSKIKNTFYALLNKKVLIRVNEQYCMHIDFYEKAKELFLELAEHQSEVKAGEFRDHLGCSRKMAIALLENFDKTGFTIRKENGRTLKKQMEYFLADECGNRTHPGRG